MKIAVCLKQVPDTANLELDPETNTLKRDGAKAVLNPLDDFPLEAAIQLKKLTGGTVTAFTMGPPQAAQVLKRAIAMGADDAVLLTAREFAGADTWATSLTLAKAIEKHGPFQLILCGKQATDGDTAQVGPGIAEHLNIPQVTYVVKVVPESDGTLMVSRMLDTGTAVLKVKTPALLTILKEANEPGFPSIDNYINALDHAPIVENAQSLNLDPADIGLQGSPTKVAKIAVPKNDRKRVLIDEKPELAAQALLKAIQENQ